jgi:hypothetical protein
MARLRLLVLLCSILVASSAAGARAAVVTVGSPLLGPVVTAGLGYDETNVNLALGGPAQVTSPVSGAIVGWHLLGYEGGPFALRVLRPAGSTAYTGVGTSSPVVAAAPALQTFATDLPIEAGDTIGLDVTKGSKVGVITAAPLSAVAAWSPPLPEGATQPYAEAISGGEFPFNAEVQPAPTITSLATSSGPVSGGTVVTISGTDFEGADAVKFGSTPAASFTLDSDHEVTATSPASASASAVSISVTTIAGTATSSQPFVYQDAGPPAPVATISTPVVESHCVVPNLAGKKLKASKREIKAAHCKLGKTTRRKGVKPASAKVVGQSKKPGTVLPAGSVVRVTLGPGRTLRS